MVESQQTTIKIGSHYLLYLNKKLGNGAFGEIYLGLNQKNYQEVAIKLEKKINKPQLHHETRILKELQRGTGIPKIYYFHQLPNFSCLIQELLGPSLENLFNLCNRKFSLKTTLILGIQMLNRIEFIHNHGIIHRDIKPGNIFYLADGTVKVSDFGIAVDAKIDETKTEQGIMGSIYYLAPEICQGKQSTVQSDIYSIGVTFYELITGRLPFEDGRATDIALAKINKNFPSPKRILPSCPDEIEAIILKACSKNPKDRYASAIEIKNDLENYINNSGKPVEKKGIFSRFFGFK